MDDELELIKRRKMLELQRKILERTIKEREAVARPDFYSIFLSHLTDDGKELFERALNQYPKAARRIAEEIGKLYYMGRVRGSLDARAIYGIFAELGYPIRVETKIMYKKRGEVKSISELLKED